MSGHAIVPGAVKGYPLASIAASLVLPLLPATLQSRHTPALILGQRGAVDGHFPRGRPPAPSTSWGSTPRGTHAARVGGTPFNSQKMQKMPVADPSDPRRPRRLALVSTSDRRVERQVTPAPIVRRFHMLDHLLYQCVGVGTPGALDLRGIYRRSLRVCHSISCTRPAPPPVRCR
jgi:hypothetical protein